MKNNYEVEQLVASHLLKIKAVKLSPDNPFVWASGWNSPIYCDNRVTLSYPVVRNFLRQEFVKIIKDEIGDVDLIAGVATGGIAIGALIAQELGLPFVYVRSSSKAHGLENKIEGFAQKGQSVVVIEDLISTGGSSLRAVEALRNFGCNVKCMLAIFTYGFPVAEKAFTEANCEFKTLSNYNTLISAALKDNYITEKDMEMLKEWRTSPETWGK